MSLIKFQFIKFIEFTVIVINRLNITPYIDMFINEPAPQTTVPLLNKVFTGWISYIQSLNCAYFHLKEWHEEFPKRLEILYAFYEEKNRKSN